MEQEEEETLSTPGVIEKYQISAKIANSTPYLIPRRPHQTHQQSLRRVQSHRTLHVVRQRNLRRTQQSLQQKAMFKGLAFPTCISIN